MPDAQIVATVGGNACIAAYEAGVTLVTIADVTLVTPARRVFVYPHSNTISAGLTDDGWVLVERSVLWAMGQLTAVSLAGKLATTWAKLTERRVI